MTLPQIEKTIRRIRQRIFDYYDQSEEKGQKASRILAELLDYSETLEPDDN